MRVRHLRPEHYDDVPRLSSAFVFDLWREHRMFVRIITIYLWLFLEMYITNIYLRLYTEDHMVEASTCFEHLLWNGGFRGSIELVGQRDRCELARERSCGSFSRSLFFLDNWSVGHSYVDCDSNRFHVDVVYVMVVHRDSSRRCRAFITLETYWIGLEREQLACWVEMVDWRSYVFYDSVSWGSIHSVGVCAREIRIILLVWYKTEVFRKASSTPPLFICLSSLSFVLCWFAAF